MRHIHTAIDSALENLDNKSKFTRLSTRAITLKGNLILMVYTKRYDDYSLPGGGLKEDEDIVSGMIRELKEETGAKNIIDIKEFGVYEEYRPWYKADFDIQHIKSYCYICTIDKELGETKLEENEIRNGVKPIWIDINEAIAHNEKIILENSKKGMSIERETFLLHLIKKEILINSEKI